MRVLLNRRVIDKPATDKSGRQYPYYLVVAGNHDDCKYVSDAVFDLSDAISLYNEVRDYHWSNIEYHVSDSIKHVFTPIQEGKKLL